jgi:hypothetical protein
VARIRLYVTQSLRTVAGTAVDEAGTTLVIPFLRVFVNLRIGSRTFHIRDAIVDTGSPLTVIPHVHWRHFEDEVEWLTLPTGQAAPPWLTGVARRADNAVSCRLGRVSMAAFDLEQPPRFLAPVSVLGLFEEQRGEDDRILVGLHGSILQGRRSFVDPDGRDGWIEDR